MNTSPTANTATTPEQGTHQALGAYSVASALEHLFSLVQDDATPELLAWLERADTHAKAELSHMADLCNALGDRGDLASDAGQPCPSLGAVFPLLATNLETLASAMSIANDARAITRQRRARAMMRKRLTLAPRHPATTMASASNGGAV